jgi:hypothetical protein
MRRTTMALITCLWTAAAPAAAQADEAALKDLQNFLNDPAQRAAAAAKDPQAAQVQQYFVKFPPYAQQELNAIVMDIMRESGVGATKHIEAHKAAGAQAAYASFSPAVKARISALTRRLKADPSFNSPANLEMLRTFMPAFLGAPGS